MNRFFRLALALGALFTFGTAFAQFDPYEPDQLIPHFIAYGTSDVRSLEPGPDTETPDVDHYAMTIRSGEAARFTISELGDELSRFNIQIVVFRVFLGQRQPVSANNTEMGVTSVGIYEQPNPNGPPLEVRYEVDVYEAETTVTGGGANYRFTLEQTVIPAPTLSTASFSVETVKGGKTAVFTVRLSGPAPSGGATVSLHYFGPVSGPASVTIEAGKTVATVTVSTQKVNQNTFATVTASYNGVSRADTITVTK
jgi:hypothetical protein